MISINRFITPLTVVTHEESASYGVDCLSQWMYDGEDVNVAQFRARTGERMSVMWIQDESCVYTIEWTFE